ncbi:MAG: von Willebrand factor type A domain-containing protein [Verrucomicrobiota bacterium]
MNDFEIMPDDPRLTAYALGELEGDERASIEAAVRANPELRAAVEEIRATAAHVETALAAEAAADVLGGSGLREFDGAGAEAGDYPDAAELRQRRGKIVQFPQLYYVLGGLAAACVALFVLANREQYEARERAQKESAMLAQQKAAERQAVARSAGMVVQLTPMAPVNAGGDPAAPDVTGKRPMVAATPVVEPTMPVTEAAPTAPVVAQAVEPRAVEAADAKSGMGLALLDQAQSVATAETTRRDEITPGQRPMEAKFAFGGPAELFPAATRIFVPPVSGAESASGYSKTPASNAEIVTLSTVEVTAPRERGQALTSAGRRVASAEPESERNHLPRPPSGARFGRHEADFAVVRDNAFQRALFHPQSTFAADIDTVSYSTLRRTIGQRELPAREGVRIEELLNYFPYNYAAPKPARALSFLEKLSGEDSAPPFAASLEVAEAPWAPTHRLVRVGLRARDVATTDRAPAHLVFLLDVSGSMNEPNKLPLVKESLRLLLGKLRADDRVAIVTYAGNGGVALASTPVAQMREILAAIDALTPSGVANGATGIRDAYAIAQAGFTANGINRVILCTDGDFNVGPASESALLDVVQENTQRGVFLTVLGFGMGNYRDSTLERLADHGNGSYGYIDSRREAQKLLVEQVSSTLVTIARDVKIQVEFNPLKVSSYRLIGYENRLLKKEDFDTDTVDAGEIGAGHCVTALYEIVPVGAEKPVDGEPSRAGDLKYIRYATEDAYSTRLAMPMSGDAVSRELLTVKVRYKKPEGTIGLPRMSEFALTDRGATFAKASADFRFAAAVAQFGMILRNSEHRGTATMSDVIAWATAAAAGPTDDPGGYRGEFIELARLTQDILRSE